MSVEEMIGNLVLIVIGAIIAWKILMKILAAFFNSDLGQIVFMLLRWIVSLFVILCVVFMVLNFLGLT